MQCLRDVSRSSRRLWWRLKLKANELKTSEQEEVEMEEVSLEGFGGREPRCWRWRRLTERRADVSRSGNTNEQHLNPPSHRSSQCPTPPTTVAALLHFPQSLSSGPCITGCDESQILNPVTSLGRVCAAPQPNSLSLSGSFEPSAATAFETIAESTSASQVF